MTLPGVRAPVYAWAIRYTQLVVNADRLYQLRTGRHLVAYTGPEHWVT